MKITALSKEIDEISLGIDPSSFILKIIVDYTRIIDKK